MRTWFYNTRFSVKADSTSHAMDKSFDLLSGLSTGEFSAVYDPELNDYDIRFGFIGVEAISPLEAYKELRSRLVDFAYYVSFDSYTIGMLTVKFSVATHLDPKLEEAV